MREETRRTLDELMKSPVACLTCHRLRNRMALMRVRGNADQAKRAEQAYRDHRCNEHYWDEA